MSEWWLNEVCLLKRSTTIKTYACPSCRQQKSTCFNFFCQHSVRNEHCGSSCEIHHLTLSFRRVNIVCGAHIHFTEQYFFLVHCIVQHVTCTGYPKGTHKDAAAEPQDRCDTSRSHYGKRVSSGKKNLAEIDLNLHLFLHILSSVNNWQ